MKLLMITGDRALAQGKKGPFYYTLEEFSKHWERIDVICPKVKSHKPELKNIFNNVFVHSSLWPLIFQPKFIAKEGIRIFKEQNFDLFTIHSYPPFYNDIGGLWLYKKIKKPYVLEVHHITGYPKAADFKEWFYKILTKLFIKIFARNAKAIRVVNQKQTPEFLVKFGADKDKIIYVPSAYIDLETFKPIDAEKKYDAVFAGRLAKNKGIGLLLEAVKKIKIRIPEFKLIIVGTGPLEEKIKKYIKENSLQENVSFSGWLQSVEDVAKIYNQAKIFIMPSLNEGGPRVNLEAMACNTALVTTRVGLMPDIIKDGENGVFVDWKIDDIVDKTINLLRNENLRGKIAENGRETVQQFERKKMIYNYAKIIQGQCPIKK